MVGTEARCMDEGSCAPGVAGEFRSHAPPAAVMCTGIKCGKMEDGEKGRRNQIDSCCFHNMLRQLVDCDKCPFMYRGGGGVGGLK